MSMRGYYGREPADHGPHDTVEKRRRHSAQTPLDVPGVELDPPDLATHRYRPS